MSAIAFFSHIEQQLNILRAKALQDLEDKAKTSDEQLHKLSNSYIQLKGDFEYNVQLLDGRDAELAQRDADLAQRDAELSERNAELSQCQKQLQEQMALHEQLQQELAAANEECEMQQSLLQQAEAVWQDQHDKTASELAQTQRSSRDALAALQSEHTAALEASQREAGQLQNVLSASKEANEEACRQQASLSEELQDLQKEMAGLNRQHAEAGAEQAAHAKCLQHKIVALEKELAQEHAKASSAEEALAVSEQHLQQQLDKAQIELRAESARAEEELKAVQGRHAAELAASDTQRSSEHALHVQQLAQLETRQTEQMLEAQHQLDASNRQRQRQDDASKAALARAALHADDMAARLGSSQKAALTQDKVIKELQELNRQLVTQKAEAERLLAVREADAAQLQQEVTAMQQAEHSVPSLHPVHGRQNALRVDEWQMSISEAAANRYEKHDSDPAMKALLEDNRKLQAQLEEEEMKKMRLGAALATLRADMESLSAAHASSAPEPVPDLERQLEAAQRDVTRLTAENESLMDISNALAAEKRQASEELGAQREQDRMHPPQRPAPAVQYRHVPPWWPPQQPHFMTPPGMPPVPMPVHQPVPVQYVIAPQAPLAGTHVPAPQPQTVHQAMTGASAAAVQQQPVPAGPLSAAGADMAARLQRIEALAAEIARAQVNGTSGETREVIRESPEEPEAPADTNRRRSSIPRLQDPSSQAKRRPSQKDKLRALQQRPSVTKVPRVRNWNMVDDTADSLG